MRWELGRSGVWSDRNTTTGEYFQSLPPEIKERYERRAEEATEAAINQARLEEAEDPEVKRAR